MARTDQFGTQAVAVGERWQRVAAQGEARERVWTITEIDEVNGDVFLEADDTHRTVVGVGVLVAYWARTP